MDVSVDVRNTVYIYLSVVKNITCKLKAIKYYNIQNGTSLISYISEVSFDIKTSDCQNLPSRQASTVCAFQLLNTSYISTRISTNLNMLSLCLPISLNTSLYFINTSPAFEQKIVSMRSFF